MSSSVLQERPVFSERTARIEISATMAIAGEAARMRARGLDLADFGAGEPHFATPRHIKDAAIAAIESNFTKYTPVAGIPELRRAIAERHAADFGSSYGPDESIASTGGKLALFEAVQVLVSHGDEVILPVPYWTSFKDLIQYAGGIPVTVETREEEHFRLYPEAVERALTSRTKLIILNSPCNPSGSVVPREDLEKISAMARRRGIYLLSDECYAYFDYAGAGASAGSFTRLRDHIVIVGSLSKTYAMTGWRLGFALGPKPVIDAMAKLQSQSTSGCNSIAQKAAVAALTGPQQCVGQMRDEYLALRSRVMAGLLEIEGLSCTTPQGAFYAYPNVSAFLKAGNSLSVSELTARLLLEARVVTVPGTAFGTHNHIRLSYAVPGDELDRGLERMKRFFHEL